MCQRVMRIMLFLAAGAILILCLSGMTKTYADEGMWTFDNPPFKQLKERFGFTPTQEWLDHVRLSSVRFMDGGSGSFISPDGLVLTNHHVAVGQLQKMSNSEKDYVETGFLACTPAEEIKSPDLEVNVLISMEDVTRRVQASVKEGMSDADSLKSRQAEIARIEKESLDKTGLRSNIISLYQGGEYWLYRFKKYTDVRLVMAPERQAAYYGGDFDNFTYPRYDLDMAYFRVYENGKPLKCDHYLRWNPKGLSERDLVFISGNPGSTNRLHTYAQLEFQRDLNYPMILGFFDRTIKVLREYSALGKEQERRALIQIFGLENSKKAMTGEYQGLLDKALMAGRKKAEEEFRLKVASNPEWDKAYGDAWDTIAEVVKKMTTLAKRQFFRRFFGSDLAGFATSIVRTVVEVKKPDADRIPGYHDSELNELRFTLFSPAPIYKDMEECLLANGLKWSLDALGPDDEFMKTVLNGESPESVAKKLVEGTKLADAKFRQSLVQGGEKAVQSSNDPLIVLARKLDPLMRSEEKWDRDNIQSVMTRAGEKIAKARFAAFGKSTYPDATFTLRLSYGAAVGYPMNGTVAPYKTTLYGLYDRALSFGGKGDFRLPERFWERKDKLDLSTPVNFVSTCDIIGGNSGSPVVNRNAELVGLIFDGNIESLSGRFAFDETKNRAVAVHCAYMLEGLRKLYDATALADEIEGKK
ncbi:MAG: S46 family peptidase [Candidatus Aminicenantes bacterium]|nr:S46 family peptidase [Candidatus Aminicenantes bacterium]